MTPCVQCLSVRVHYVTTSHGKYIMKKITMLASAALSFGVLLSGPALAGSSKSDRPSVVAEEGGISIHLGERDHDRDARRHHPEIGVVGGRRHRDRHHEGDHDHDRDR